MTKISSWQIDGTQREHTRDISSVQFENTVRNIMVKYILREIGDMQNTPEWDNYKSTIHDTMGSWKQCPDQSMAVDWNTRYQHLVAFYIEVVNAYTVLSHDPHLAEIYKDKIDQAMDCLLDSNATQNAGYYPLISIDADLHSVDVKTAAHVIFQKRQQWAISMAKFERLRLFGIRDLMEANIDDLLAVCTEYIKNIRLLYTDGY